MIDDNKNYMIFESYVQLLAANCNCKIERIIIDNKIRLLKFIRIENYNEVFNKKIFEIFLINESVSLTNDAAVVELHRNEIDFLIKNTIMPRFTVFFIGMSNKLVEFDEKYAMINITPYYFNSKLMMPLKEIGTKTNTFIVKRNQINILNENEILNILSNIKG